MAPDPTSSGPQKSHVRGTRWAAPLGPPVAADAANFRARMELTKTRVFSPETGSRLRPAREAASPAACVGGDRADSPGGCPFAPPHSPLPGPCPPATLREWAQPRPGSLAPRPWLGRVGQAAVSEPGDAGGPPSPPSERGHLFHVEALLWDRLGPHPRWMAPVCVVGTTRPSRGHWGESDLCTWVGVRVTCAGGHFPQMAGVPATPLPPPQLPRQALPPLHVCLSHAPQPL